MALIRCCSQTVKLSGFHGLSSSEKVQYTFIYNIHGISLQYGRIAVYPVLYGTAWLQLVVGSPSWRHVLLQLATQNLPTWVSTIAWVTADVNRARGRQVYLIKYSLCSWLTGAALNSALALLKHSLLRKGFNTISRSNWFQFNQYANLTIYLLMLPATTQMKVCSVYSFH